MENLYFEVDFEKYCKTCEHKDLDEKCDPCCECLDHDCKQYRLRLSDSEESILDELSTEYGMPKAEILRRGLRMQHNLLRHTG